MKTVGDCKHYTMATSFCCKCIQAVIVCKGRQKQQEICCRDNAQRVKITIHVDISLCQLSSYRKILGQEFTGQPVLNLR